MLDNRKNKITRFFKYPTAGLVILIFIGLITLSGALAQWPPYNESFFSPSYSLLNSPPEYGWYRGLENTGDYLNGGYSSYNNSFYPTYGNSFPSSFSSYPGSLSGGLYGGPYGGLYALSPSYNYSNGRVYDFFLPSPNLSFEPNPYPYMTPLSLGPWASPSPWQGVTVTANNSWSGNWWSGMPTVAACEINWTESRRARITEIPFWPSPEGISTASRARGCTATTLGVWKKSFGWPKRPGWTESSWNS